MGGLLFTEEKGRGHRGRQRQAESWGSLARGLKFIHEQQARNRLPHPNVDSDARDRNDSQVLRISFIYGVTQKSHRTACRREQGCGGRCLG